MTIEIERDEKGRIKVRTNEIWRTHEGHYVRIQISQDIDTIVTTYENGAVKGYSGANFDAYEGTAIMSRDYLVEKVQ